jgi:hypothetical protein
LLILRFKAGKKSKGWMEKVLVVEGGDELRLLVRAD